MEIYPYVWRKGNTQSKRTIGHFYKLVKNMKIRNYDAPAELVIKVLEQAIPDFILEVIRKHV